MYPANLQKTCQHCHAEAGITFPQAWLSHYAPTWENTPLLFGITSFYKYLLFALLAGMGVYILIDVRRRIADRLKKYFSKSVSVSESQSTEK